LGGPPAAYKDDMTLAEGYYYVNLYGGYDINDELFDGASYNTGAGGFIEDMGSYDCKYEWYAWWHDNHHGPGTTTETNWIQSRNRRQQFNRIKFFIDAPEIDPPRLTGDLPNFTPTKGQLLQHQFDFTQIFEPYDGEQGCYTFELTRGKADTRQIPDWIRYFEGNSTLLIEAHTLETVHMEFKCCNKWDQCAEATFSVIPQNLPPRKKISVP